MTFLSPVAPKRSDATAAIVLLLVAEAALFFNFLFVIGPIAAAERLVPLLVVLALCATLFWRGGQEWARWALLVPITFRVWRIVRLAGAAWGLGRTGVAVFLTFIMLAELLAAFVLVDSAVVRRQRVGVV